MVLSYVTDSFSRNNSQILVDCKTRADRTKRSCFFFFWEISMCRARISGRWRNNNEIMALEISSLVGRIIKRWSPAFTPVESSFASSIGVGRLSTHQYQLSFRKKINYAFDHAKKTWTLFIYTPRGLQKYRMNRKWSRTYALTGNQLFVTWLMR